MFHSYINSYVEDLKRTVDEFDRAALQRVAEVFLRARDDNRQIFLIGNGGSAAAASHMACDLGKGTIPGMDPDFHRFRVISLCDNNALITALGNDVSFESIFVEQLRALLNAGDVVVAISASGNSPNLITALEFARARGATTVGLLGFGGGKARGLVDVPLVVSSRNYGIAEDFHLIVQHIVTQYLKRLLAGPPRPVLFLDRDGVINPTPGPHQYVTRRADFGLAAGVAPLLRAARERGYGLIVVTNQQGVGKGLLSSETLHEIHQEMAHQLAAEDVTLDGVFVCPHLDDDQCHCRKPKPGLIHRALNETPYLIDLKTSMLLGDSETDVRAGQAAGLRTIRLQSDGAATSPSSADRTVTSLSEVVGFLEDAPRMASR